MDIMLQKKVDGYKVILILKHLKYNLIDTKIFY